MINFETRAYPRIVHSLVFGYLNGYTDYSFLTTVPAAGLASVADNVVYSKALVMSQKCKQYHQIQNIHATIAYF